MYWFNIIWKQLVYNLSEVVLAYLFIIKTNQKKVLRSKEVVLI